MVQSEDRDGEDGKRRGTLRTAAWRERAALLTKCLFAPVQITSRPSRPTGESTFLHLIVRPWNPFPLFQMASAAAAAAEADFAGPASVEPPSYPICPTQATQSPLTATV